MSRIELKNISKSFGKVRANNGVNLSIYPGEILALLGENGSGKTTLMNMLSGIYYPDEGQIYIRGEEVKITSPGVASFHGIGMIHQHFKLIDVFTAAENIILGHKESFILNRDEIRQNVKKLSAQYGFELDPDKKIYDMSVSEKQTVEIMKLLYNGAEILILDEPTAVLTPQETEKLFSVLRKMKESGQSIVIITHKLQEVLDLSDRVAVLRKGEIVRVLNTNEANEETLTDLMVGEHIHLEIERTEPQNPEVRLEVEHLSCLNSYGLKALDDVSFLVRSGEILGIAGVAGSGQKELLEAIAGLQKCESGSRIIYHNPSGISEDILGKNPKQIKEIGISLAFVPEDRLGMGLIGNMGMADNMLLRSYEKGKSPFVSYREPTALAQSIKEKLEVSAPSIKTPVRKLSGGNVQKVLIGREIASSPKILMTAYAVRGLDINTSYTIYNILNEEKKMGTAILYVGEDLDVLLSLCDRILVLCGGRVSGIVEARKATKKEIGAMMSERKGDKR